MGEHTPGPWRLSGPDCFGDYTVQSQESPLAIAAVCNGQMRSMGGKSGEHTANAQLIEAAPDLLAACEEFVGKVEAGKARSSKSYAQMKAAISKAKGRADD